jgi:hypothetical protein
MSLAPETFLFFLRYFDGAFIAPTFHVRRVESLWLLGIPCKSCRFPRHTFAYVSELERHKVDNVIQIHQFGFEFVLLHNLGKSHDDHMVNIPEMLLFDDNGCIFQIQIHSHCIQCMGEYRDQSNFEDLECDHLCEVDKLPFQVQTNHLHEDELKNMNLFSTLDDH